ncbi:MAG: ACP S-malonyltransferase, partial [Firmicutes bacterium]|nr:ACP S-malonyltransferase [Bacillota bacterium]
MQRTETIAPAPEQGSGRRRRRIGLLFPGQGAQYVGMGKALAEADPLARQTFEEADEALGEPLSRRVWEGTPEELEATAWQQPAILTVSIAVWRVLRARFPLEPVAALGLSLGEYSAYVAAGLLPFPEAVRVTRRRGQAMQEAVPPGAGGMLAVLGLETAEVERLARAAAARGWAEPANYNAPGQVVVAGSLAALDALEQLVAEAGAGRTLRLPVSAPFHCRLLTPVEA